MSRKGSKKRASRAPGTPQRAKPGPVAPLKGFEHPLASPLLIAAAVIYLAATFLGATGSKLPSKSLPQTVQYFTQTACLFPHAARAVIDYRAEGYVCGAGWHELDTSLDFFINADDKENRFYRMLSFFRRNRLAMQSLEEYLVTRNNARAEALGEAPIVGVRFSSLRLPLPEPGEFRRWDPRPLAEYPDDQRKNWYWTPNSRLRPACEVEE